MELSIAWVLALQVLMVARPSDGATHLNHTSGDASVHSRFVPEQKVSTGMPVLAVAPTVLKACGTPTCRVTASMHSFCASAGVTKAPDTAMNAAPRTTLVVRVDPTVIFSLCMFRHLKNRFTEATTPRRKSAMQGDSSSLRVEGITCDSCENRSIEVQAESIKQALKMRTDPPFGGSV